MLYPLKFEPILMPKIWGGQNLKRLYPDADRYDNIGESWLVSAVQGNESVIEGGFLADNTLPELVEVYLNDLVGDGVYKRYGNNFPLLVKIIDAADDLSIQVHPDDEIAGKRHNSFGKNEMWYILDCTEDAFVCAGFNRKMTQKEYLTAVEDGTLEDYLQKHPVKKGDYIYIPAGCVHSIGRGCTILEIQQSSDITYRIYDFNRTDDEGNRRELHTEQALEAIDFDNWHKSLSSAVFVDNEARKIIETPYFKTLILSASKVQELDLSEIDSFVLLSVVEGRLNVNHPSGKTVIDTWQTALIPASIQTVVLNPDPKAKVLITYIQ